MPFDDYVQEDFDADDDGEEDEDGAKADDGGSEDDVIVIDDKGGKGGDNGHKGDKDGKDGDKGDKGGKGGKSGKGGKGGKKRRASADSDFGDMFKDLAKAMQTATDALSRGRAPAPPVNAPAPLVNYTAEQMLEMKRLELDILREQHKGK